METPMIMRLMASSVVLASEAASIIRKVLSVGKLGIIEKGINDIQTQADRSAQHCIVSSLSKKFPGLCIIGEENLSGQDQPHSNIIEDMNAEVLSKTCPPALASTALDNVVVWVDPLDGTGEFAEGLLEHVTVLIGVSVRGRAVGGVVCQPFYMSDCYSVVQKQEERKPAIQSTRIRLIWGLEGLGLFGVQRKPLAHPPTFERALCVGEERNILVSTRSHPRPLVTETLEACAPSTVFKIGGCGFKMLMLLEGVAHGYIYANTGCKRWDTCAPEALLNCVGGKLTGMDGKLYDYSKSVHPVNTMGVIATPVVDWHSAYLSRIPESVVQSLASS